jgi:hypothetical protein
MIEGGLNILLDGIGAAVAQIGMRGIGLDDVDTARLGLFQGRQNAGVGFEIGVL